MCWRRFQFVRSETARRVLWAVPWVIFAVFIVVVGGFPFTIAMIGLIFGREAAQG